MAASVRIGPDGTWEVSVSVSDGGGLDALRVLGVVSLESRRDGQPGYEPVGDDVSCWVSRGILTMLDRAEVVGDDLDTALDALVAVAGQAIDNSLGI
jgi:hypothetical protein